MFTTQFSTETELHINDFCKNDMRNQTSLKMPEHIQQTYKLQKLGHQEGETSDYCKIDAEIFLSSGTLNSDGLIKRILKLNTVLIEGDSVAIGYIHLLLGLIETHGKEMAERMEKTLILKYKHVLTILLKVLCDSNFYDFKTDDTSKTW